MFVSISQPSSSSKSYENTETQGKNTIYIKRRFKRNFIMMMYENKAYDKKTYPKLVLNKLKVMRGLTPIYTPLGT